MFVVLASEFVHYSVGQRNLITLAFLYYFAGLVASRFGSLVIEPLLKRTSFLRFAKYEEFVAAEKDDPKIQVLSEVNNTYRTFCSVFVLLLLLKLYTLVEIRFPVLKSWDESILAVLLLVLFLFSYRKQTAYVADRTHMSKSLLGFRTK